MTQTVLQEVFGKSAILVVGLGLDARFIVGPPALRGGRLNFIQLSGRKPNDAQFRPEADTQDAGGVNHRVTLSRIL